MGQEKRYKPILLWLILVVLVLALSSLSVRLWGEKSEKAAQPKALTIQDDMSLAEFGTRNQVPNSVLKKVFTLTTKEDLQKKIKDFGLPPEEISRRVNKASVLESEHESKNWVKIPVKFAAWILFLGIVFLWVKNGRMTPARRRLFLLLAVVIFGIILGSDPSPMGTVKDAVVLFGKSGAIFPPRMIALTIFLILAFIANKFICSWGCQLGTLQDLIFRFNRNATDRKGIFRQFKPPFVFTHTVRILFFAALVWIAFAWKTDLMESFDPFKIFHPSRLDTVGLIFVSILSVASLFVYRPWCHLFCPFGLVGWIVEKVSRFKINVHYDTCIACEACAKACPSTVMNAILKQEQATIPDCFACSTCIQTCPTQSIHFEGKRRNQPPVDKFKKR